MSNADNMDVDYDDANRGDMPFVPTVSRLVTREPFVDHRSHRGMEYPGVETMEVCPEGEAAEGTVASRELTPEEKAALFRIYQTPRRLHILGPEGIRLDDCICGDMPPGGSWSQGEAPPKGCPIHDVKQEPTTWLVAAMPSIKQDAPRYPEWDVTMDEDLRGCVRRTRMTRQEYAAFANYETN